MWYIIELFTQCLNGSYLSLRNFAVKTIMLVVWMEVNLGCADLELCFRIVVSIVLCFSVDMAQELTQDCFMCLCTGRSVRASGVESAYICVL